MSLYIDFLCADVHISFHLFYILSCFFTIALYVYIYIYWYYILIFEWFGESFWDEGGNNTEYKMNFYMKIEKLYFIDKIQNSQYTGFRKYTENRHILYYAILSVL